MKKFLTILSMAIGLAAPAAGFAFDFSNVVGVDSELQIVKRVSEKTIFADIVRVQSYDTNVTDASGAVTVSRKTNEQAVMKNNNVVIGICQDVQQIKKLSTEQCGVKTEGRTRLKPVSLR